MIRTEIGKNINKKHFLFCIDEYEHLIIINRPHSMLIKIWKGIKKYLK